MILIAISLKPSQKLMAILFVRKKYLWGHNGIFGKNVCMKR